MVNRKDLIVHYAELRVKAVVIVENNVRIRRIRQQIYNEKSVKQTFPMLKDVGMTVPNSRETRAI